MAMTSSSMRQRLEAYMDLRYELKLQATRLDQMRQTIGDISSPKYEAAKAPSNPGDSVARNILALEALEERVDELSFREGEEHDALERIISSVRNAQQRAVLRMRYFGLFEWADISFSLYGDRTDFVSNEHDYVRKCYRLHTRAIVSMVNVCR